MSETEALFSVLRQSADPDAVAAIETLVQDGPDHALCRINVLDFAKRANVEEEVAIAAFLHAARLAFRHPFTGDDVDVTSPLPADLESALQAARR